MRAARFFARSSRASPSPEPARIADRRHIYTYPSLPDPDKLFNAGLGGTAWRAIDLFEGDKINERALKNLVRFAVDYNQIKLKRKAPAGTRAKVHKNKKG
jgi:hypothetical protein